MSTLQTLVALAKEQGASDLHLEAGLPPALRVRGMLRTLDQPISGKETLEMAQALIDPSLWNDFLQRRSHDLSKIIHGVRCRINVLQTSRGIGMAVRLLAASSVTLETLNLHPDLRRLIAPTHGLLVVTGATGSGKTSTVAALVEEMNQGDPKHLVTIESPIEYYHRPKRAYIRQREVGRDTPSFDQALLDALREDPDVLVVGEMRDPETMRLTLNAAETGHLVITTMHSSTTSEALQRIVSAFSPEMQSAVRAQLAECLVGVLAQRLRYKADLRLRVPECEVLLPTHAVRSHVRSGEFHKLSSALETGAEHGMWTFARYGTWVDNRKTWNQPSAGPAPEEPEVPKLPGLRPSAIPFAKPQMSSLPAAPISPVSGPSHPAVEPPKRAGRIEIEPEEGGLNELIKKLGPS